MAHEEVLRRSSFAHRHRALRVARALPAGGMSPMKQDVHWTDARLMRVNTTPKARDTGAHRRGGTL